MYTSRTSLHKRQKTRTKGRRNMITKRNHEEMNKNKQGHQTNCSRADMENRLNTRNGKTRNRLNGGRGVFDAASYAGSSFD